MYRDLLSRPVCGSLAATSRSIRRRLHFTHAMSRVSVSVALACLLLISGCKTTSQDGITQVATIDALLAGVYDGHMSLHELGGYGDFGIGTFEGLDGEMVLLNGTFHKVRANGKVYQPSLSERTPFACVTRFVPDCRKQIATPINMNGVEALVNTLVPEDNRFCAFTMRGVFSRVITRSVPAQKKPYPPLVEVTRNQSVFTITNICGTIVGFRSPAFVKGVNVPGFHIHFLANDLSGGGHVLDFEITRGLLEADTVHQWLHVYLPSGSSSFSSADLKKDRSTDLQSVEKQTRSGVAPEPDTANSK